MEITGRGDCTSLHVVRTSATYSPKTAEINPPGAEGGTLMANNATFQTNATSYVGDRYVSTETYSMEHRTEDASGEADERRQVREILIQCDINFKPLYSFEEEMAIIQQ